MLESGIPRPRNHIAIMATDLIKPIIHAQATNRCAWGKDDILPLMVRVP